MIVRTVGELKSALEFLTNDMPLSFMAEFMDRGRLNYLTIDRYEVPYGEGIKLCVYKDGNYCRIENFEATDLTLSE